MSKFFAVLDGNNIVSNLIVANSKEDAELVTGSKCIQYTFDHQAWIGDTYFEENDEFLNSEEIEALNNNG